MAMTYGTAYVAQVALGAKDSQTVKAFEEAESYPGTSLIIAYSPCIEHGYTLGLGLDQQKLAVDTGFWPLYRFDPRRLAAGEPGLKLDSAAPKVPLEKFWATERRFPGRWPARTRRRAKPYLTRRRKKSWANSPFTKGCPPRPARREIGKAI